MPILEAAGSSDSRLGLIVCLLVLAGCKGRAATGEVLPARVSAGASAAPTVLSARPAVSAHGAAARQPADDEARARAAAYSKALAAARRATRARDYEQALAEFDRALKARPGDPRAYAEQGYAALLAKKFDLARDSLGRAASATSEHALRAQIFYNLGLVREGQGQDPISAFAISNYLHASAAAQKKLAGKNPCPVEVDRSPEPATEQHYSSWLAFVQANQEAVVGLGLPLPQTEQRARDLACSDPGCPGASPWVVKLAGTQLSWVRERGSGLSVLPLASLPSWKQDFCYPSLDMRVVQRSPSTVTFCETGTQYESVMYCGNDGTDHVCQESELGESGLPTEFTRACKAHPYTTYRVLDVAAMKWTLRVTQWQDMFEGIAESERPQLEVADHELRIRGAGCDLSLPIGDVSR